jgi:hypothetical protein
VIRLIATLLTAVVVVWIGSRLLDEYDTELWQTQKSALRERLAGAARSVAALAEEPQPEGSGEPVLEAAPMPPREAAPPRPEIEFPTPHASLEDFEPAEPSEEPDSWGGSLDDLDVERVRRRLDRVMTLAAGAGQ